MDAARSRWTAHGLAGVLYLGLAIALWSGVWLHHPTTTSTCGCGDTSLLTWFMAWPAYALTHGQSLFFSTRALHPQGINLPANTSFLAISLPLTPVTWAFGPVASLNVAATLAPAADAMAPLLGWSDARIADEIASCRRIQETNMAGLREVARTMPDRHDTGAFADTRPHAARIPDPSSPN